jgi:hypothetical protein
MIDDQPDGTMPDARDKELLAEDLDQHKLETVKDRVVLDKEHHAHKVAIAQDNPANRPLETTGSQSVETTSSNDDLTRHRSSHIDLTPKRRDPRFLRLPMKTLCELFLCRELSRLDET